MIREKAFARFGNIGFCNAENIRGPKKSGLRQGNADTGFSNKQQPRFSTGLTAWAIFVIFYIVFLEVYNLKQDLKDLLATIERVNKQLARQEVSWNIKMFHLREKTDVFSEIGDRIISGEVKIDQVKEFFHEYTSAENFLIQALIWSYRCGDWQKSAVLGQKIAVAGFNVSFYVLAMIKKSMLYARDLAEEIQDKKGVEDLTASIANFGLKYDL